MKLWAAIVYSFYLSAGRMGICFISLFILSDAYATKACHPLLWPSESPVVNSSYPMAPALLSNLRQWSDKVLNQAPQPVVSLSSSGRTDLSDPQLIVSREAFKDADRAALFALTYRLTHQPIYLKKTTEILLSWAKLNHPTGNPIDETRLEGIIWAYDLIACDLSLEDKTQLLNWLKGLRLKKLAWHFGKITDTNNHRIHQLKMLLLLDIVLGYSQDWQSDVVKAIKYSTINLDPQSGMSIDYLQRNALYYHNYVLQPWLEINLITGCCEQSVKQAFAFLSHRVLSNQIKGEFAHSQAKIDALRAQGGFEYAKKKGRFDITKAVPTIIAYYTLVRTEPDPRLWLIQQETKPSLKTIFLKARRDLWIGNE